MDVCFASLSFHLGADHSAFMLCDEMLLINYCLKIWTLNETAFLPKCFGFFKPPVLEWALNRYSYNVEEWPLVINKSLLICSVVLDGQSQHKIMSSRESDNAHLRLMPDNWLNVSGSITSLQLCWFTDLQIYWENTLNSCKTSIYLKGCWNMPWHPHSFIGVMCIKCNVINQFINLWM